MFMFTGEKFVILLFDSGVKNNDNKVYTKFKFKVFSGDVSPIPDLK